MNKKIILACLMTVLISIFTGCDNTTSNNSVVSNTENSNVSEYDDWGVSDEYVVSDDDYNELFVYIKVPYSATRNVIDGKIASQEDGTLVLLTGQRATLKNITVEDNEHVLDAYEENIKSTLDTHRGMLASNFEFDIQSRELVEVNGYEMCKYKGIHTYSPDKENDSEKVSIPFVAYSVQTKEAGLHFLWMVLDDTKDQSANDLVESNADKMAQTFSDAN